MPPFYQGHSQVVPGGRVKVVALTSTDPAKLNFTWSKDGQAIGSASGLGGNILAFTTDPGGRPSQVSLTVTDASASSTLKTLAIVPASPLLRLYEKEPLLGPNYWQAITERYQLTKPAITLVAQPYFFPKNTSLAWEWRLEGQRVIDNVSRPAELTLTPPESGGEVENELIASAGEAGSDQTASAKLIINFGGQPNF